VHVYCQLVGTFGQRGEFLADGGILSTVCSIPNTKDVDAISGSGITATFSTIDTEPCRIAIDSPTGSISGLKTWVFDIIRAIFFSDNGSFVSFESDAGRFSCIRNSCMVVRFVQISGTM
jgi:hypothetical protein